jgi:hypothetical protein
MHQGVTDTPCFYGLRPSGGVLLAQKNRVVGEHRWVWGCEEAHRALLYLHLCAPRGELRF